MTLKRRFATCVSAFALVAMLFVGFGAIGMAATANFPMLLPPPGAPRGKARS